MIKFQGRDHLQDINVKGPKINYGKKSHKNKASQKAEEYLWRASAEDAAKLLNTINWHAVARYWTEWRRQTGRSWP
jgi:hypothetical protein